MDSDVYRVQHPDWRVTQRRAVEFVCADKDVHVWVALDGPHTVGFVALKLHAGDRMGEIYMIAVDPDFQRRGIATALTHHSLAWLKKAGMTTVMVETGGDPGHAPARRTYESAAFGTSRSRGTSRSCEGGWRDRVSQSPPNARSGTAAPGR